jgi:hypothetical protein
MKRRLFCLLIILAIFIPLLAPSGDAQAADTVKLTVKNKSGSVFVLRLSGPESYTNTVKKGTSKFDVVPGVYRYSYTACGTTQTTGTINANKNAVLVVAKCPPGLPPLVTFTLKNKTDGYLQLTMTGRQSYTFNVPPGDQKLTVYEDKYRYTATGCGGLTAKGRINIKSRFKWWEWTCK